MTTRPLPDMRDQPGDLVAAQSENELAESSEQLWLDHARTARTVAFMKPRVAPFALLPEVDTAYAFYSPSDSGDPWWLQPWYVQTQHSRIRALVTVATNGPEVSELRLALRSQTLVTYAETTVGPYVHVSAFSRAQIQQWRIDYPRYRQASVELYLDPVIPEDRRIALTILAVRAYVGDDYMPEDLDYNIKIQSVLFRDVSERLD